MMSDTSHLKGHELETVRLDVVDALKLAERDPASPLRTPVIATVDKNGAPQARVMVLRHFDEKSMTLRLFTDARSPKLDQLRRNPNVQAVFYDGGRKLHFRIAGTASFKTQTSETDDLWGELPEFGRGDYLSRLPPGAQINDPTEGWIQEAAFGSDNFCVLEIAISEIDWLQLSASGHKRAQLKWRHGQCEGRWLTP